MPDEWVYGLHPVQSLIERDPLSLRELWVHEARGDARVQALVSAARRQGISVNRVPRSTLDRRAGGGVHQGVLARCRRRRGRSENLEALLDGLDEPALIVVLDGVQDPHNLGAVLRSADAAGAHAVIAPRARAVGLTPVVRKAACGAAETVTMLRVANLVRALTTLQAHRLQVIGTAGDASQSLFATDLTGPVALVLGGEGRGLRRLTRETCDWLVGIPMAGAVESLNVSAAAAVCLFEARRQRQQAGA